MLETRRAEAAKLLALAQVQLEKDATEALAYATSSLELADTPEARGFAVRALWAAPPARVLTAEVNAARDPVFSPDGRWLAASGHHEEVFVWRDTGGDPIRLPGHTVSTLGSNDVGWSSSKYVVTGHWTDGRARIWSIPEGHLIRTINFGEPAMWQAGEKYLLAEVGPGAFGETGPMRLMRWDLPDGEAEELGSVDVGVLGATNSVFDPNGRGWLYAKGNTIFYRPLPVRRGQTDVVVGRHENDAVVLRIREGESDRVWSRDRTTREYRCWSLTNPGAEPLAVIPPPPGNGRYLVRDLAGQWRFVSGGAGEGKAPELWDLDAPAGARTVPLRRNDSWYSSLVSNPSRGHLDGHALW